MTDAREGWLKPERPMPWTADGYVVRDANGDGFAECPTRADAAMIAALTASPATTQGSEAELRERLEVVTRHLEGLLGYLVPNCDDLRKLAQFEIFRAKAALATPKPVEAETCAVCGKPESDYHHTFGGSAEYHPFQPKPTPPATATECPHGCHTWAATDKWLCPIHSKQDAGGKP